MKPRKAYTLKDLRPQDLDLLRKAYNVPVDSFICFGNHYYKLEQLGLISDENQITLAGRQLVWELMNKDLESKTSH